MNAIRVSLVLVTCLLFPATEAIAGPVQFLSGNVAVRYEDTVNGSDFTSFPLVIPGTATVAYHGTALDPSVPIGDDRGNAGATYDVKDLDDGATFNVEVFHTNKGDEQRTLGGDVDFGFAFRTDRILHFTFTAIPTGPSSEFTVKFASVTEDLKVDVFGNTSGSLRDADGNPTQKSVDGTLPAGTHTLSLFLEVVNGRVTTGGSGGGAVQIALSEANPPPAIPLPAALWPGLAMLAGTGVVTRMRKSWRRPRGT